MSTTDQAAATCVAVGAAISTTAATMAALANWICIVVPWMTRMRAGMVSTTAITRGPAAFGGGGMADRALADKTNEAKPKNADDVSDWLYHNNATKQRWI